MFTFWFILSFILTLCYAVLQFFFYCQWKKTPMGHNPKDTIIETSVAIIIPVRNEALNISKLLASILQQNFPKDLLEIILVDDFSEDDTSYIAKNILQESTVRYKILALKDFVQTPLNAYKKKAITIGIEHTQQTLIVTTDADCTMQPNWIKSIVQFYEKTNANLIASPVLLHSHQRPTFFSRFQILDFCGMQLITAACLRSGVFNMANGANLTYKREAFISVNGFEEINQKASGDDMLLVYKIAQLDKQKVFFNKNIQSVVQTNTVNNLKEFIQQRFRWTSKTTDYQDKRITLMLGLVLLFCISLAVNLLAIPSIIIYYKIFPNYTVVGYLKFLMIYLFLFTFSFQLVVKTIADYILLHTASKFFSEKRQMKGFVISEVLHILYIIYVGVLGNFIAYSWKGRKVK